MGGAYWLWPIGNFLFFISTWLKLFTVVTIIKDLIFLMAPTTGKTHTYKLGVKLMTTRKPLNAAYTVVHCSLLLFGSADAFAASASRSIVSHIIFIIYIINLFLVLVFVQLWKRYRAICRFIEKNYRIWFHFSLMYNIFVFRIELNKWINCHLKIAKNLIYLYKVYFYLASIHFQFCSFLLLVLKILHKQYLQDFF